MYKYSTRMPVDWLTSCNISFANAMASTQSRLNHSW